MNEADVYHERVGLAVTYLGYALACLSRSPRTGAPASVAAHRRRLDLDAAARLHGSLMSIVDMASAGL